jgi:Ribbon-helix-helix protein, copG family
MAKKYTVDVRTKLSEDQLASVRAAARDEGANSSEIMRKAVEQYVEGEVPPAALRLVEKILETLVPAIRAEVQRAVADAPAAPVQKAVDPALAEAMDRISERLDRAEAMAGV